jgi:cyanate permease
MQRIWAVVLSVWAMLAIVAVLAWSHRPVPPPPQRAAAQTLVIKGANGKSQLVVVQPGAVGAAHATTSTSGVVR